MVRSVGDCDVGDSVTPGGSGVGIGVGFAVGSLVGTCVGDVVGGGKNM